MGETILVMGMDFGTDSVRAIVVNPHTGEVAGKGISAYRRWADQQYCHAPANRFRQHPLDYLESMDEATTVALKQAGPLSGRLLRAICVATTGSTPAPVDESGRPLALSPQFADNPNAMFFLWKDHTASAEAAEVNASAASWTGEDFLKFQGLYSSEWFWAKILKAVRDDQAVKNAAWNWIEECEWITAELCGGRADFARSCTAAGHKALWHSSFGGLPSREFLCAMDPYFGQIYDRYTAPIPPDRRVGTLGEPWRSKWGAEDDVAICGSLYDAHAGAVGCGIRPGTLIKVIGTSAVDMAIEKPENIAPGKTKALFGMAENSIVPGYVGIEAGQAAFGDVFKWLERLISWPNGSNSDVLAQLSRECEHRPPPKALALDWFNGRRYPHCNDDVKACLFNLDLSVDAPTVYQALALGVAFGARRMMDGFVSGGIRIDKVICAGGIAKKSPYIVQVLSDILCKSVAVSASDEACAKGAAMYAALVSGAHRSIFDAQDALSDGILSSHSPNAQFAAEYKRLFGQYMIAGDFMERLAEK